jgi:cell shape-determining protein MreD
MRGPLHFWVVIVLLILLHFLLHVGLGIGTRAPDLLTIALLLSARELRMGSAAGLGLFLGLLEDAFSILAFGANAVAMTVVAILGSRTRDLFVGDSFLFLVCYLALGKWTRDLVHWIAAGDGVQAAFVEALLVRSPVAALYAVALGIVAVLLGGILREAPR